MLQIGTQHADHSMIVVYELRFIEKTHEGGFSIRIQLLEDFLRSCSCDYYHSVRRVRNLGSEELIMNYQVCNGIHVVHEQSLLLLVMRILECGGTLLLAQLQ